MLCLYSFYFICNYRLPVREVAVEKPSSSKAPKPEKIDISANQARNQTGEKLSSVVLFVTNYFNIQGILKYT